MKRALSLLVENNSGVMSRISGLYTRRGYSIESITAGVTADERFTRLTMVADGDQDILDQIEKQLAKLEDVVYIKNLSDGESVFRELILVKIRAKDTDRAAIMSVCEVFRARIVDVASDSLIIELTGTDDKLQAFLRLVEGYEILELARTGVTGLSRGSKDVKFF